MDSWSWLLRVLTCTDGTTDGKQPNGQTPSPVDIVDAADVKQVERQSSRPQAPRVRGHRFSKEATIAECAISPRSTLNSEPPHAILRAPQEHAPHVLVLDPGSGEACLALQQVASCHVHLAVGPSFDQPVKRYPPHWRSMAGVKLTEADAEADATADAASTPGSGAASWPGISDLRGVAHPRNLATWASVIYDGDGFLAVNLSATGCDRGTARLEASPTSLPASGFSCLICGSRGGEVTLPALWRLGCRLPAVCINGGCARREAAWTWPPHVPVVLVTGGRDLICNEFHRQEDGDAAYLDRLWQSVPQPNRATTAILHLPSMSHRPNAATLRAVLPSVISYAAAGLAESSKPSAAAFGFPAPAPTCILVTAACPHGEALV